MELTPGDGVPPSEGMRASDHDRDQAVELLTTAVTDGRLTLEEFSERSGSALAARTVGELTALTTDLGRPAGSAAVVASDSEDMYAFLGNESRKGRWVVPEHLTARSVLGDCHIEMQRAVVHQRVTTIDAVAKFGSVTIFVPDGVDVRLSGRAMLGAKSSKLRTEPRPGAPVVVVRCDVFCGTVTVRSPTRLMH